MKTLLKTALLGVSLVLLGAQNVCGQIQTSADLLKIEKIKSNPERYNEQGGQVQIVPEFNSKSEKEAWFNPYGITSNEISPYLSDNLQNNKDVRQIIILADDPAFPVYYNTGNKEQDDKNYAQHKQEWISNNQVKYNQMTEPASTPLSRQERILLDSQQPQN